MKKTGIALFLMLLAALLSWQSPAFGCVLEAAWVDGTDGNPDIAVSSDGKTVTGQLKITNNDTKSCPVKADMRVYSEGPDSTTITMASKVVSFKSIKPGSSETKSFSVTAKAGYFFGRTLAAVVNPKTSGSQEQNDGSISYDISLPGTTPDLSAEWANGLSFSGNLKKISGNLTVTNYASDQNDPYQNAGKFGVTVNYIYEDPNTGITKTKVLKKFNLKGLKAGESKTLPFSYSQNGLLAGISIVTIADSGNDIYETNLNNNLSYTDTSVGNAFCKNTKDLTVLINAFDFGSVKAGAATSTALKIIANCSESTVTLTGSTLNGPDFETDWSGPVDIPPGASYVPKVTFGPVSAGKKTANFIITTNNSSTLSVTVALSGTSK